MSHLAGIRLAAGSLGRVIAVHLDPGLDLLASIRAVVAEQGITSGIILSGAGSLKRAVLRNVRTFPTGSPSPTPTASTCPRMSPWSC